MPRLRKTRDIYIIQQYSGALYGWEDVSATLTRKEAQQHRNEYRANQPQYRVRIIKMREKIDHGETTQP